MLIFASTQATPNPYLAVDLGKLTSDQLLEIICRGGGYPGTHLYSLQCAASAESGRRREEKRRKKIADQRRRADLTTRAAKILAAAKFYEPPAILATVDALVIPYDRTGYPNPNETEIIKPGALRDLLNGSARVSLFVNHDPNQLIARRSEFGLRLSETSAGLHASFDIPDTLVGRQLLKAIQEKRLRGWSFWPLLEKSKFTESKLAGKTHRRITNLMIHEISAITLGKPAYAMTSPPKVTLRK